MVSDAVNANDDPVLEFQMTPANGDVVEIIRDENGSREEQIHMTLDLEEFDVPVEEVVETAFEEAVTEEPVPFVDPRSLIDDY